MIFSIDDSLKRKCPSCGYIALPPYPDLCPKCQKSFGSTGESSKSPPLTGKEKMKESKDSGLDSKREFAKNLTIQSKPNLVVSSAGIEQKPRDVKQIEVSKEKVTNDDDRVKVKVKKTIKIDFNDPIIELGSAGEYLKFMGIISRERVELFASNPRFQYFLELGANLDYIASSILKGELDRMLLSAPEGGNEEICYFLVSNELIFMIYGNFLDKKAAWLLNQMKVNLLELTRSMDLKKTEKIQLYNVSQSFQKRAAFLLEEYIKLQEVFTAKKLESLDNYLRLDYFGLSFQSIGVLSKILTNHLEISDLPPIDPNDPDASETIEELKESMITAKVEAIAANTVANTQVMPNWISVKLGFQHYRFLIFAKIRQYFISLLAEGNLDYKETFLTEIKSELNDVTMNNFVGDLAAFKGIETKLFETIKKRNV